MKKIASIVVVVFGLVLIGLNYTYNSNSNFKLMSSDTEKELVDQSDIEVEKSTFDVSKLNLPSVFDLLSKLI